MVVYNCELCNKQFKQKCDFTRHKNKKTPCNKPQTYSCSFCQSELKTKYNLNRHLKSCENKQSVDKIINEQKNNIHNGSHNVYNEAVNNTITNDNSIKNDNSINIIVVPYGKEVGIDDIPKAKWIQFMYRGYSSLQEINEYIHFNRELPENHNIFISNLRTKLAQVFDGNVWTVRKREEFIEELLENKYNLLEEMYNYFIETKEKRLNKTRLGGFLRLKKDMEDDNEKTLERLREDLELQLFNKKHIPLDTHKRNKT